jgi:hypothetical protein
MLRIAIQIASFLAWLHEVHPAYTCSMANAGLSDVLIHTGYSLLCVINSSHTFRLAVIALQIVHSSYGHIHVY